MHPTKVTWKFFLLCLINLFLAAPIQVFLGLPGLVATQVIFFVLLALFWSRKEGSVLQFLRIREVPLTSYFWAITLSILAIPTASLLNSLVVLLMRALGLHYYVNIDITAYPYSPALMLIIIAVVPGLCEEVMFRGYFLRAYQKNLSARQAILLSAILFGIIHFNIYNLLSPIYLGLLFGALVYVYDSLIPAVLGHTFFNAIIYYMQLTVEVPEGALESVDLSSVMQVVPLSLLSILLSVLILRRIYRTRSAVEAEVLEEEAPTRIPFSAWIPLILSGILFVGMMVVMEWILQVAPIV